MERLSGRSRRGTPASCCFHQASEARWVSSRTRVTCHLVGVLKAHIRKRTLIRVSAAVQANEFIEQTGQGECVGNDVVLGQQNDVLQLLHRQHGDPPQRRARQVEEPRSMFQGETFQCLEPVRIAAQIDERHIETFLLPRKNQCTWLPVNFDELGSRGFVALREHRKATPQQGQIKLTANTPGDVKIVERRVRGQAVEKPETLLSRRQRHEAAFLIQMASRRGTDADIFGCAARNELLCMLRDSLGRRMVECEGFDSPVVPPKHCNLVHRRSGHLIATHAVVRDQRRERHFRLDKVFWFRPFIPSRCRFVGPEILEATDNDRSQSRLPEFGGGQRGSDVSSVTRTVAEESTSCSRRLFAAASGLIGTTRPPA